MTELYKGFDKTDLQPTLFLVNERGCAPTPLKWSDEVHIAICKENESLYLYEELSYFDNCIDPILIAEW